jgi:hypothetical protein
MSGYTGRAARKGPFFHGKSLHKGRIFHCKSLQKGRIFQKKIPTQGLDSGQGPIEISKIPTEGWHFTFSAIFDQKQGRRFPRRFLKFYRYRTLVLSPLKKM